MTRQYQNEDQVFATAVVGIRFVGLRKVVNFPSSAPCYLPAESRGLTFSGGGPRLTGGKPAGFAGGVGRLVTCRLGCARGGVTARDYVGGRVSSGNCGTGTSCTRRGLREKRRWEMYVLLKKGAADYGALGRYDPPKLWISLFSFVFLLFVSGQWRRSTRARGG